MAFEKSDILKNACLYKKLNTKKVSEKDCGIKKYLDDITINKLPNEQKAVKRNFLSYTEMLDKFKI